MSTLVKETKIATPCQLWAMILIKNHKPSSLTELSELLNQHGFLKSLGNTCALARYLRSLGWVNEKELVLTDMGDKEVKNSLDYYRTTLKKAEEVPTTRRRK